MAESVALPLVWVSADRFASDRKNSMEDIEVGQNVAVLFIMKDIAGALNICVGWSGILVNYLHSATCHSFANNVSTLNAILIPSERVTYLIPPQCQPRLTRINEVPPKGFALMPWRHLVSRVRVFPGYGH